MSRKLYELIYDVPDDRWESITMYCGEAGVAEYTKLSEIPKKWIFSEFIVRGYGKNCTLSLYKKIECWNKDGTPHDYSKVDGD